MRREDVQALYTRKAGFYHRLFIDFFLYGKGLAAYFRRRGGLRPGMRILDAGCGTGIQTRNLYGLARDQALGGIVFNAFDLTESMLDLFRAWIRRTDARGITLHRADVLRPDQLPADWRGYDLIVSSAMLEYLDREELGRALANLARLAAPGGEIVVFITRRNFLMRWLIEAWWKANMYEKEEILRIFDEAGLDARLAAFPFPYNHLNLWGLVIEARRKAPEAARERSVTP